MQKAKEGRHIENTSETHQIRMEKGFLNKKRRIRHTKCARFLSGGEDGGRAKVSAINF